jgi:hypothetical protein
MQGDARRADGRRISLSGIVCARIREPIESDRPARRTWRAKG